MLEVNAIRPVIGHIRNARATAVGAAADAAGVMSRAPDCFEALDAALAEMRAAGVTRLVIEGGDGTVREVLSRVSDHWGADWPEFAILPRGNTNLIARKTGGLPDLAAAERAERRVALNLLKVERDGLPDLRGFIMGAGAYEVATRIAQEEIAARHGPQVLIAILRLLTGKALRAGAVIGVNDGRPEPRMLFAMTTLPGKLIFGCEPFWDGAGRPIRWLDVAANPPLLLVAAPFVAFGRPFRWMRRAYRSGDAAALSLTLTTDFVMDGEAFPPGPDGRIQITAMETATFVTV